MITTGFYSKNEMKKAIAECDGSLTLEELYMVLSAVNKSLDIRDDGSKNLIVGWTSSEGKFSVTVWGDRFSPIPGA